MRKQSKIIFYAGIVLGVAAVLTGVALSGGEKIPKDFTVSYEGIKTADITAGVSVHDRGGWYLLHFRITYVSGIV